MVDLLIYCCDKNVSKTNLERKGFIWLMHADQLIVERCQGRSPNRRGRNHGGQLFISFFPKSPTYLSYTFQDRLPMNGTTHSGLSPSTSISKQGNATKTRLLAFLIEAFPQLR